jgi:hypothetical protein
MTTERDELNQQFADGLAMYIEQLHTGAANQAAEASLPNPETESIPSGFLDVMYSAGTRFNFYEQVEDGDDIFLYAWKGVKRDDMIDFQNRISDMVIHASTKSKWGNEIQTEVLGNHEARSARENNLIICYAALNAARKSFAKSDAPIARLESLMIPAFVAAFYKPTDQEFATNPKKHKNETQEETVYRTAFRDVKMANERLDNSRLLRLRDEFIDSLGDDVNLQEVMTSILKTPEAKTLRKADTEYRLWLVSKQLLEGLMNEEVNARTFRDQLDGIKEIERKRLEQTIPRPEPEVEETEWTILPPGTLEELEGTGTSGGGGGGGETPTFVDPERMKWLARLAICWGPDAYIAVANLDKSGNYDYRVAILPQHQNGVVIEHAVAENPSSGNAIYAFRGEKGVNEEEGVWLTWRQVFRKTKQGAKSRGARKILHGDYVDENVLEYITRSPDDLDKRGYQR